MAAALVLHSVVLAGGAAHMLVSTQCVLLVVQCLHRSLVSLCAITAAVHSMVTHSLLFVIPHCVIMMIHKQLSQSAGAVSQSQQHSGGDVLFK